MSACIAGRVLGVWVWTYTIVAVKKKPFKQSLSSFACAQVWNEQIGKGLFLMKQRGAESKLQGGEL